jgi:membrane associated rhomboid family serine protease
MDQEGVSLQKQYTAFQNPFGSVLTPWVKRLLIANVAVFFVTAVVGQALVFRWFAFAPSEILLRPWGVLTYMFLHGDFWHLFFNMLVLFFFGPPLENRWGSKEFLKYYLLCGLGGVALSFLFVSAWIVGASAATYGLMLAFAMNWPNSPIYIWGVLPVKAKWLVGFMFVVSLFSAFGGSDGGIAHFAHLGGLLSGLLYLKSDWRPNTFTRGKGRARKVRRMAIVPREAPPKAQEAPAGASEEWAAGEEKTLDQVDRILDKISAQGISALTPEERRVLDDVSRKHRSN